MTEDIDMGYIESFKDVMFNTGAGRLITLAGVATGLILGYKIVEKYTFRPPETVIEQRQVIGGNKADIFIKKDGIRYFSHVDGKEISDIVREK